MHHKSDICKTVTISREYDKLCILERLLDNNKELEHIVSNFIDSSIEEDKDSKFYYFDKLRHIIKDNIIVLKIVQLSNSIAFDKPITLQLKVNNNTDNIINYLNNPFIPLLFNII